jgi:hypothetical protein
VTSRLDKHTDRHRAGTAHGKHSCAASHVDGHAAIDFETGADSSPLLFHPPQLKHVRQFPPKLNSQTKPYCFKGPSNSYIVMYSNVHCVDLVNTKTICPYTSEASMQFSYYWALSKKNAMVINWM